MARAPRTPCHVCKHALRPQIEIGLANRTPLRILAARFGVSSDSLWRHGRKHLSAPMRAAILAHKKTTAVDLESLRVSEAEGLLSQLVAMRARLQAHSDMALATGNTTGALMAERTILANLEMVGRLLGTLIVHTSHVSTNILITADYLKLRQAIVTALRPFPDAARAVGQALAILEADAARDIAARASPAPPLVIDHAPGA